MDFSYAETFPGPATDGYERLLHDAMIGDATLFIRTDEVEQAWRITDPFLEAWSDDGVPLAHYAAGTWGPHEAELLLANDLRQWRGYIDGGSETLVNALAAAIEAKGGRIHLGAAAIDWSVVDVLMGDERCVPPDDPDSNQRLVRESLLDRVAAVAAFHPMICEEVENFDQLVAWIPAFDLVHLGLGPAGHTASLFPDSPDLEAPPGRMAVVTTDPNGNNPHPRMTLTFGAIARARRVVFTISGGEKHDIWTAIQAGQNLPATRVRAAEIIWIVDHEAAGG